MSIIPSLSTLLSLLSFLTTVFVLARVGAAAFSANVGQPQDSDPSSSVTPSKAAQLLQFQLGRPASGREISTGMSLLQAAIRFGSASAKDEKERERLIRDNNSERERGMMMGYIGGHELVRMPASTWTGVRRPGLLFRPPSPFPDQTKPLSMAKLIMSRHQNQRRTNRPPPPLRRPPGLPPTPPSRSRLVEEV